ncbi:F-box/FBD/LRR-repeat protein At4g26340-like [Trifolium pratense]|uniref:F-box/FBD/LRR-repeat protein At4g26340-like n=1 Tax=Trifolium pratense TaxID=57577 RepID=UPI001E691827|nr:F-box/FBD/LRR-repeat protein At4g26340-like [Trifolium pratense]
MAEEDDIISTLPDAILCHILSFLHTKQSFATTILSKRWKNLYLSLPVLHFKAAITDQTAYVRFINFVYSALLSRDPAFPIKTFYLDFTFHNHEILSPHSPVEIITKWVKFVTQRGVEYIDLYAELEDGAFGFTELPISSLSCNTLVVLNLLCFSLEEAFSPIALPSLKTLHLENVSFPKLRDFMLFLSGCPILEDLFIFNVLFDSEESLTCDEWKTFCLTNLTRADIDCFRNHFPLKAVHNVVSLRLPIDQVNCRSDFIPTFHNLTQLELVYLNYSWHFLLQVLKLSPKLQELKIDQAGLNKDFWTRKDDKENWVDPDSVPQCLSLHLRTCILFNFLGLQGELLLAKYILKNARVLQTMKIRNVGQTNIKRLISSYPRDSTMCKVTIYQRSKVSSSSSVLAAI